MRSEDDSHVRGASSRDLGNVLFDNLAAFRARLIDRIREVASMTETGVMGAAENVHAIFQAASTQIVGLRALLGGGDNANNVADDLTQLIEKELKVVGAFAAELNTDVSEQVRLTREAERSLSGISAAAGQVSTFAGRAKMLALNARIEAFRGSEGGRGFAVIADEMKELSRAVAETNASIQTLASDAGKILPSIVKGANRMHARSKEFSEGLGGAMRVIAQRSAERRNQVASAVAESDGTLKRIVESAHRALSHMQFQDAVAQGLMRLDGMLMESQLVLCEMAGLDARRTEISPAMHVEIGGDKSVLQKDAGEVMLF